MYEIKNYQAAVDQANAMVDQIDAANGLIHRVSFVMTVPQPIKNFQQQLPAFQEIVGEQMSWIYNIIGAEAKLIRRRASPSMMFRSNGTAAPAHILLSEYEVEFSNPDFMMAWTHDSRDVLFGFARGLRTLEKDYPDCEDYRALASMVHDMVNVSKVPWFSSDWACEEGETYAKITLEHAKQYGNQARRKILDRVSELEDSAFFNTDFNGDLVTGNGAPVSEWVLNRVRHFGLVFIAFTHRCINVKGTPIKQPVGEVDGEF